MSCRREKAEVDRLSSMCDEVLSQILSLMPTKYAVRTSILSKRWRYLWMSVTNLDFDDIQPNHRLDSITECVDRVLRLCKTSHVKLFRLPLSRFWHAKSSISSWISEAVRLNVCELDIEVRREPDVQVSPVELPVSLFTCKTLTTLRLHSVIHDWDVRNLSSSINLPAPVNLPCLKTLDIDLFEEHSVILFKLIHGCPLLESLTMNIEWHDANANADADANAVAGGDDYSDDDDVDEKEFSFNIPTLKRLELTIPHCSISNFKVVLNLPNLQYLFFRVSDRIPHYSNEEELVFVIEDLSSLVEATIDIQEVEYHKPDDLLRGISAAESLSWVWFFDIYYIEYPTFSNLKRLEVKLDIGWRPVFRFLQNAHGLEYLSIDKCTFDTSAEDECDWIEPPSVPTCMLINHKTLHVEQGHLHVQFFKYMLGNAEVLKTLTLKQLYLCLEDELQLCAHLLKIPRASRYCEVHFVGNYVSI